MAGLLERQKRRRLTSDDKLTLKRRKAQLHERCDTESAGVGAESCLTTSHPEANGAVGRSPSGSEDDGYGHFVFEHGEDLTRRYKILKQLGEGTYGRVLECWDREEQDYVAIKVVRNTQHYRDAAKHELDVLRVLDEHDRSGSRGCVHMRHSFDHHRHICIVFDRLGPSLYNILRRNNYRPFHVDVVRSLGYQLLQSVAYVHELKLIHTDLKLENILLTSQTGRGVTEFSEIKLIDFGSATFDIGHHSSVVSTRHYRAPEVILGLGWSYPCDMWSVGCILVEFCSGEMLFNTHETLEHLAMMEKVLGPIPQSVIQKIDKKAQTYFRRGGKLNWPYGATSRESIRAVRNLPRLERLVRENVDHAANALNDLLWGLLKFDPLARLTAREALGHPFFRDY